MFPLPCSEKGDGEEERSMHQMLWLISDEEGGDLDRTQLCQ